MNRRLEIVGKPGHPQNALVFFASTRVPLDAAIPLDTLVGARR
jgi:hypothetical protein